MFSDFARSQARKIEPRIYKLQGGKPSVTMMRRADTSLDTDSKDRYRASCQQADVHGADLRGGGANQAGADAFYEQAGTWLRENTRDTKKFSILFNETSLRLSPELARSQVGRTGPQPHCSTICAGLLWRNAQ